MKNPPFTGCSRSAGSRELHMTTELEQYRRYGERIEALIRPATFPLAVRVARSEEEIDPAYKRPSRDLNLKNFVCQNFKMVRTYGWTMAVTEADINCRLVRAVYGWDEFGEEEKKWDESFNVGLYAKDSETAREFEKHRYALDEEIRGLIISPLTRTKVLPDTVLCYCLPAQAMRFVQSYLFMTGGVLE